MTFSVLSLAGLLEVSPEVATTVSLALFPFALTFPLGAELIERGARELGPVIASLLGVALIGALTTNLPLLDRITDWIAGITDTTTERTMTP